MFARTLVKAAHVRRFSITQQPTNGWEVRDERDEKIRFLHYEDWHRVERARRAVEVGCTLSIDSDAHKTGEFEHLRWGISQARRAYDQFREDARRQGVMPGWLR